MATPNKKDITIHRKRKAMISLNKSTEAMLKNVEMVARFGLEP